MEKDIETNIAFIDGQNLYSGTKQNKWKIDFNKLRKYLQNKYQVTEAYYYLGFIMENEQELYANLQKSGFIVMFKEHNSNLKTIKKGNVDTDIVFETMKNIADNADFSKILLISGDGDYKKMVDYLVKKERFKKILFPNKEFASSLYKTLGSQYFDYLENTGVRKKIEFLK